MLRILAACLLSLLVVPSAWAAPRIFYTDVVSGPNTGGEGNNGTYLSIFGKRFGTTRGTSTVRIGGVEVATYKCWNCTDSYTQPKTGIQKITVQLGSGIPSGTQPIVVTVDGVDSNDDITFTVRAGTLRFVDCNAAGGGTGTFASPYNTITPAHHATAPGDFVILRGPCTWNNEQAWVGYRAIMALRIDSGSTGLVTPCTETLPCSYITYPQEAVTFDSYTTQTSSFNTGFRLAAPSPAAPTADWITISGIRFNSWGACISMGGTAGTNNVGTRIVNNDCWALRATAQQQSGLINPGGSPFWVLGNYIHGARTGNKLDHAIYVQACNWWGEQAWNWLEDNNIDTGPLFSINYEGENEAFPSSARCALAYPTATIPVGATTVTVTYGSNFKVGDHISIPGGGPGGAALLAQVTAKSGNDTMTFSPAVSTAVPTTNRIDEMAGDVFTHDNWVDSTTYPSRCFYYFESSGHIPDPVISTVYVFNNVFNGCGMAGSAGTAAMMMRIGKIVATQNTVVDFKNGCMERAGVSNPGTLNIWAYFEWRNNICISAAGAQAYYADENNANSTITKASNLYFGALGAYTGSDDATKVNADPLFVDAASHNYHLQSSSPARDAGSTSVIIPYDFDGIPRDATPDIGAFEYAAGGTDVDAPTQPGTPSINGAATVTTIPLTWTASTDSGGSGLAGYHVYVDGVRRGTPYPTTNTYTVTGLAPSTSYAIYIRAYDNAGNVGVASATANLSTAADTTPPNAPTNVQVTAVSSSQLNLTWTAPSDDVGVSSYNVYRCTGTCTPTDPAGLVGSTSSTSFGNTGLLASTQYSYCIKALDAATNKSACSATQSGTTTSSGGSTAICVACAPSSLVTTGIGGE